MEPRIIYDKKLGSFFIRVPKETNSLQSDTSLEVFDLYPCDEDLRAFWSINLMHFLLEFFPRKAQLLWEDLFRYCPGCGKLPGLLYPKTPPEDPIKSLPLMDFQCDCGLSGKRFNLVRKGERYADSISNEPKSEDSKENTSA